ncbi:MAG: hypothetical protein E6K81_02885 [Candidatus Eisenbacteria bacterium]|uniref:Gamma-glutamylcyclotransferase AIG2-like domain-containing protein n=1 Tax=Eiseniibacteriota bacterium TaxID=2212470 RepID=A0A538UD14_UNCEI|nr:MAG: hypothetical protein E6K81_02885 [Candidatus Eisenbacteria bacterium]
MGPSARSARPALPRTVLRPRRGARYGSGGRERDGEGRAGEDPGPTLIGRRAVAAHSLCASAGPELARADGCEAAFDYVRIAATLASGKQAWVYVHGPTQGPRAARPDPW